MKGHIIFNTHQGVLSCKGVLIFVVAAMTREFYHDIVNHERRDYYLQQPPENYLEREYIERVDYL